MNEIMIPCFEERTTFCNAILFHRGESSALGRSLIGMTGRGGEGGVSSDIFTRDFN